MVSGVVPSPPRCVSSIFIEHWVQHSHCSSIFIELRGVCANGAGSTKKCDERKSSKKSQIYVPKYLVHTHTAVPRTCYQVPGISQKGSGIYTCSTHTIPCTSWSFLPVHRNYTMSARRRKSCAPTLLRVMVRAFLIFW